MEWSDWAFIVPIVAWLSREIWGNISKNKLIEKQANTEHEYYKKKFIFEQKNEFYKEMFRLLRYSQGSVYAFTNEALYNSLRTTQIESIDRAIRTNKNDEDFDANIFTKEYLNNEYERIIPNFDNIAQKVLDSTKELNNFAAINKYMLTEEEGEIYEKYYLKLVELKLHVDVLNKSIESKALEKKLETELEKRDLYEDFKKHFDKRYAEKVAELEMYINEFEKQIRKSFFE